MSFPRIAQRRNKVIGTLGKGVRALLAKNRLEVVVGEASLHADREVRVGEAALRPTTALVLATGSVRRAPKGVSFGGRIIGTEEAWALSDLPASIAVVGAGASGTEIASAYARLGTEVRLIESASRVLPIEDSDISAVVERGLQDQGIDIRTSVVVTNARSGQNRARFRVGEVDLEAEWLVVAVGRRPDVDGLGLARAGVELTEAGFVAVDRLQRTSADGVYAVGDLVVGSAVAHKASEEGIVAVETAAGNSVNPVAHACIPRCTFSAPNVGSVGLTEDAALAAGYDDVIGKAPYSAVGAGAVYGDRRGLVKLVGDRRYGTILGAHIVGARATELIQQVVNAMTFEGRLSRVGQSCPRAPNFLRGAARGG